MIKKRKMRDYLGLAMLLGVASQQQRVDSTEELEHKTEKKLIIPPGARYYHFRRDGVFDVSDEVPDWAIFSCIARSDQKAITKFENFNK